MNAQASLACVLAQNLPVQVEHQRRRQAISLLIPHPVDGATVFAMSDDVAGSGVQIGMSVYQARQTAPSALVIEPDETEYHARHGAIEASLRAFSPLIETAGLGEFLVDVRGLKRGPGGDQALAEAMQAAARSASGLAVSVGLAAGKFTAQQAARCGVSVVPPGAEARFLAPLPLDVLTPAGLPGEMRRRLRLFDIHTLGGLTALRKVAVLRQFGAEASSLYELARGNDPRPLNPDVPPLKIVRSLQFNDPIASRQILLNVTNRLSGRLSQALQRGGYHAEAVKLTLATSDGKEVSVGQAVKPPTSDEGKLRRQSAQLLGRLQPPAPVVAAALSAYPLRPWYVGAHQMALVRAGVPERGTQLEETIQNIWRRFGEATVRVAALLGPPLPLRVRVRLNQHGRPAQLEFGGETRVVIGWDEEWREEKRWWDKPLRRDYFRVLLADGSLRNIFQDLTSGEWYLDRAWPIL